MFEPKSFDELTKKLFAILPASVQTFENDIQQKFRAILQTAFSQMNLVTREEFDVQCKVLARTREKLEAMQQDLALLLTEKPSKTLKK